MHAALLGALLTGQTLFFEASLRGESRAGTAPQDVVIAPGSPTPPDLALSSEVIELELSPAARILYDLGRTELSARYAPRFFQRFLSRETPILVSNQGELALRYSFSRVTTLDVSVTGGIGEVDPNSLSLAVPGTDPDEVPGTDPGAVPGTGEPIPNVTTELSFQNATLAAGITTQLDARWRLRTRARGEYSAPDVLTSSSSLPRTLRAIVEGALLWSPDRDNGFEVLLTAEQADIARGPVASDDRGKYRLVSTRVGWNHRFTRGVDGTLGLGGALLFTPFDETFLPRFDVALRNDIFRERLFVLALTTSFAIEPFTDVFRQQVESRATASLDFELAFPRYDVSLRVNGAFTAPASLGEPAPRDPTAPAVSSDESLLTVRVPISYQVSDALAVEVGGRFIVRGTRLNPEGDTPFSFGSRRELLGYLAFVLNWEHQDR